MTAVFLTALSSGLLHVARNERRSIRESPLPQKLNFASKGRRGRRPLQGENENLEIWRFVRVTPSLPAEGGGPR